MNRVLTLGVLLVLLALPAAGRTTVAHAENDGHAGAYTSHTVQPGETLYSIARRYGVSATALSTANHLVNPDFIYVGQRLDIPGHHMPQKDYGHQAPTGGSHTVALGETLYSIAWKYGTTVSAIVAANDLSNPDFVYAGQRLRIPGRGPAYAPPVAHKPAPHSPGHYKCGYDYHVGYGDALGRIALAHGTTTYALARANGLMYPYMIYAGQYLHVPCHASTPPVVHHPRTKPKPKPVHRPVKKPAPKLMPASCPRAVQIVRPRMNEKVRGVLQIIGTADIEDFQFYKIEFAHGHDPLERDFTSIDDVHTTRVVDGVLTTWFTGNRAPGDYTLRLTAVDNKGQYPRPCDVHVHVERYAD